MQRGEDQVARLRRGEGRFNGDEVTHLADEDDVRILPQAGPQLGDLLLVVDLCVIGVRH